MSTKDGPCRWGQPPTEGAEGVCVEGSAHTKHPRHREAGGQPFLREDLGALEHRTHVSMHIPKN